MTVAELNRFLEKNGAVLLDTLFLVLSVTSVIFLAAMVFDVVFAIPAVMLCVLWLALSLGVSKWQGEVIRLVVKRGQVIASCGLPVNRKLHAFYTAWLLISFMVFFSLMVVMRELSMMLAFVSWLYIGYATLHDIGQREANQQKVQTEPSCDSSTTEKPRKTSQGLQPHARGRTKEAIT